MTNPIDSIKKMLIDLGTRMSTAQTVYDSRYTKLISPNAGSDYPQTDRGLLSPQSGVASLPQITPSPTPTPPVPTPTPIPSTPPSLAPHYVDASKKYGFPVNYLTAKGQAESSWVEDIINGKIKSPAGATGVAQFTPITLKELKNAGYPDFDPNNPAEAIPAAAFYLSNILSKQIGTNDPIELLKAYNAGGGNYRKYKGNIPFKETKDYIKKIQDLVK